MPIRASQQYFYPIDWPQLSRAIRFGRAEGCCERCGRPHGASVWHLSRHAVAGRRGLWWDTARGRRRCARGRPLPARLLPPPEDLAALYAQPAFWPGLERSDWPRRSRVVLACCHLDHDPTNNAPANLAALCQHCHLAHDRADNLARRRAAPASGALRGRRPCQICRPPDQVGRPIVPSYSVPRTAGVYPSAPIGVGPRLPTKFQLVRRNVAVPIIC